MFERYTESARRALFFSRYAVTQLGGVTIEPAHVVLGVMQGAPNAVTRFTRGSEAATALRERLEAECTQGEKIPERVEIPFSDDTKAALEQTQVEADGLNNHWIRPEHIVLSVMVKTDGTATRALREAGVDPQAIRDYLRVKAGDKDAERRAQSPPTVARQWKGVVKPGLADAYIAHLQRETMPSLRQIAGFVHATIMRRDLD